MGNAALERCPYAAAQRECTLALPYESFHYYALILRQDEFFVVSTAIWLMNLPTHFIRADNL